MSLNGEISVVEGVGVVEKVPDKVVVIEKRLAVEVGLQVVIGGLHQRRLYYLQLFQLQPLPAAVVSLSQLLARLLPLPLVLISLQVFQRLIMLLLLPLFRLLPLLPIHLGQQ